MTVEKNPFSCRRGQVTIRGFAYKCQENNGIPVVMSHAFLSNQKIMEKYAKALAQEGYVVFTYDFSGGAMFGKSDGQFRDMSIDTEKDDLKAVIAYVEGLQSIDIHKLILLGASQGGFVSCLVAAEYQARVNKLILLYPALCIPDDARKGKMLMITFDPQRIEETIKSGPFRFSAQYPKSVIDLDSFAVLKTIPAPMLLLHGGEDKIVPLDYAKRAIAVAANPASRLVILDKAGHGFRRGEVETANKHILDFLQES